MLNRYLLLLILNGYSSILFVNDGIDMKCVDNKYLIIVFFELKLYSSWYVFQIFSNDSNAEYLIPIFVNKEFIFCV